MVVFDDRVDAGMQLARELGLLRGQDVVVLGLPRGGVPVAVRRRRGTRRASGRHRRAQAGRAVPARAGHGRHRGGRRPGARPARSWRGPGSRRSEIAAVERRERAVLDARVERLRRGRPRVDLHGRVAVIVDDGIATGSTARVACQVARHLGAARVVLAVPGRARRHTAAQLPEADAVVCVCDAAALPWPWASTTVDFSPTSDDEVVALLDARRSPARASRADRAARPAESTPTCRSRSAAASSIEGHLELPAGATRRRRLRARQRQQPATARATASSPTCSTTPGSAPCCSTCSPRRRKRDRANVFDIPLLAGRLEAASAGSRRGPTPPSCRLGYFGASTGAGAALWAAAEPGSTRGCGRLPRRPPGPCRRRGSRRCGRRPCSSSAAPTTSCSTSTARRRRRLVGARPSWPSSPAPRTSSRSPGTLAEAAPLARDWFVRHLSVEASTQPRRGDAMMTLAGRRSGDGRRRPRSARWHVRSPAPAISTPLVERVQRPRGSSASARRRTAPASSTGWRAAAQPSAHRGARLHLDRRRGRLARLLADQPLGARPERTRTSTPWAARRLRALAHLDVGEPRRRRLPRLAARAEPRARRAPTGSASTASTSTPCGTRCG